MDNVAIAGVGQHLQRLFRRIFNIEAAPSMQDVLAIDFRCFWSHDTTGDWLTSMLARQALRKQVALSVVLFLVQRRDVKRDAGPIRILDPFADGLYFQIGLER